MVSFFGITTLLFLPFFNVDSPGDFLSVLDPQAALEILDVKTDDESLQKLISGKSSGKDGKETDGASSSKDIESAIQNLASSTETVREKARAKLIEAGPAVRPRLEDVVSKDSRRAEEAKKVLAALDASKKSSAHRDGVKQILAIRLAADKKLTKLVPAIQEASKGQDVFLKGAAEEALSVLDKTLAKKPDSPSKEVALSPALEALPGNTKFLISLGVTASSRTSASLRLDKLIKEMLGQLPPGLAPPQEEMEKSLHEVTKVLLDLVLDFGNVRLGDIFIANVDKVTDSGGGFGIILTGDYERDLFEKGMAEKSAIFTASEVGGKKVFSSQFGRILCLDDHTVLFLPEKASLYFPLEEYLKSLESGKRPLRGEKRWEKFLSTLKGGTALRGLALTDASLLSNVYTELDSSPLPAEAQEAIKGMTEIELDLKNVEGKQISCRAEAAFKESKNADALVQYLKGQLQSGIQAVEAMAGEGAPAGMKKVVALLKGIHLVAEGKKGIFRVEFEPLKLSDLMGMIGPFAGFR